MPLVARPHRRLVLTVLAALALLAIAATSASAAPIRGAYPVQLGVTGGVTITTSHDFTGECEVGSAYTIEAEAELNIQGRTELEWIGNKIVQTDAATTPGGAVNKNLLSGYRETNRCDEAVETDGPPRCNTNRGTGEARLGNAPAGEVWVGIGRGTGGEQDQSCQGGFVVGAKPTGVNVEALQSAYESIALPLDLPIRKFQTLPVGKKLSSRVKLGGPCKLGAKATASTYRDDVCTVKGEITVTVKRVPGKGRGVSLARLF
jgi:hypothetical protein